MLKFLWGSSPRPDPFTLAERFLGALALLWVPFAALHGYAPLTVFLAGVAFLTLAHD